MRPAFRFLLIAILLSPAVACNRFTGTPSTPTDSVTPVISSRPPFQTKEPERYRAIRVITSEEYFPNSSPVAARSTTTKLFKAGTNRREEYEAAKGLQLVYLENAVGRFVFVPSIKSYAELNIGTAPKIPQLDEAQTSANVTQGLLAEAAIAATYQLLGPEQLNGRKTIKYLVRQSPAETTATPRDTFIWVDNELGMPIRSESTYTEAGSVFRFSTELREISNQVDENVFALPPGLQKLEHTQLMQRIAELTH